MTLRLWQLAAAVIAGLAVSTAGTAGDLTLDGELTQGGFVIGRTLPGSTVTVTGRRVRVSEDGVFLLGFGRDAANTVDLTIRHADGRKTERELAVSKRKYKISRVDGLPESKVSPPPEDLRRIKEDNAKIANVRKLDTAETFFQSGFVWPVTGRLSGIYGSQRILNGKPRSPHNGIDVAAPKGTPVAAIANGRVALTHDGMFLTGKTVMIDHGHGLTSVYIHMNQITVKSGDVVSQGQQIGTIGMTGRATGPHLHWGVSLFKTHLDPALLVGSMPEGN